MKKIFYARRLTEAIKKALERYPSFYYVTARKLNVKPNCYEITLKKRKRKKGSKK